MLQPIQPDLTVPSRSYVLGIELDEAALETARENLVEAEVDTVDIIRADVAALNNNSPLLESLKRANFDTVVSEWRLSIPSWVI